MDRGNSLPSILEQKVRQILRDLQSFHALLLSSNPMPYIHSHPCCFCLASIECRIQYGSITEGNIELKTLEAECAVNILPRANLLEAFGLFSVSNESKRMSTEYNVLKI